MPEQTDAVRDAYERLHSWVSHVDVPDEVPAWFRDQLWRLSQSIDNALRAAPPVEPLREALERIGDPRMWRMVSGGLQWYGETPDGNEIETDHPLDIIRAALAPRAEPPVLSDDTPEPPMSSEQDMTQRDMEQAREAIGGCGPLDGCQQEPPQECGSCKVLQRIAKLVADTREECAKRMAGKHAEQVCPVYAADPMHAECDRDHTEGDCFAAAIRTHGETDA